MAAEEKKYTLSTLHVVLLIAAGFGGYKIYQSLKEPKPAGESSFAGARKVTTRGSGGYMCKGPDGQWYGPVSSPCPAGEKKLELK